VVAIVCSTYGWSRVATSHNEPIVVACVVDRLWAYDIELIEVQPKLVTELVSIEQNV